MGEVIHNMPGGSLFRPQEHSRAVWSFIKISISHYVQCSLVALPRNDRHGVGSCNEGGWRNPGLEQWERRIRRRSTAMMSRTGLE